MGDDLSVFTAIAPSVGVVRYSQNTLVDQRVSWPADGHRGQGAARRRLPRRGDDLDGDRFAIQTDTAPGGGHWQDNHGNQ
ncbi:hypothetical protein NIE79_004237 [Micromonospora sp. NIE79]|uniref:Uncharacterized protein n=1 Tax=Micromonospora trifolii TaxID=2911208 RepID=A0ABS9N8B2_9ACTN|nr:hypothetical protein [Micromonospora trifolii]MCG5445716.1 hypothetical protein [Micromonospora trifolii]